MKVNLRILGLACCMPAAASLADTERTCDLTTPGHGTFCETTAFVLPQEQAKPFEAELETILSAPADIKRGGPGDLEDTDVHFCMLLSDDRLGLAFIRNKHTTKGLIRDLIPANGFAACRTQPEYVLMMLERQSPTEWKK